MNDQNSPLASRNATDRAWTGILTWHNTVWIYLQANGERPPACP